MSEQENIRIAEELSAALNARDLDLYLSHLDESVEIEGELLPGPVRGHDAVRQLLEARFRAFPDGHSEVEQIIASGDYVVVRSRFTGTNTGEFLGMAPTNKTVNYQACAVAQIRDGKAIWGKAFADNATLLQQLGVVSLGKRAAAG